MTCRRLLRSIRRDDAGTSFMELAFILPFLLLLLLGSIDMSRMISTRMDLEQAAQRTTDFALSVRPTSSSGQYLVNEAIRASGLTADNIGVQIYLECNAVRQANFDTGCPVGQERARYVSVTITEQVQPFFDWSTMGDLLGTSSFDRAFTIVGDSTVRFQ